jgi:superfamily II DNA or RNA helicase
MEKKSDALLRYLTEMPAAIIYALADKVHLFNGFELCKRLPVSQISWSEDGAVLRTKLSDAAVFQVSISLNNGELSSSCDCGVWSPRGRCPHIVASLATVKKALAPSAFPMLQLPEKYLEGLRAQLPIVSAESFETTDATPAADQPYSLMIDRAEGEVRIRLFHDGEVVSPFQAALPSSIRDFLRILYSPTLRGRCIEEFLSRFGGRFPILYAGPDGVLPLSYDAASQRLVLLRLDLRDAELRVTRTLEDGTRLDDGSFLGEEYHFDLREGRIRRVADAGGDRYLKRLLASIEELSDAAVSDADGFHVPLDSFNKAQFQLGEMEFPHFLTLATLCINGLKVPPRVVQPRYRLDIMEFGDQVRLVGEGVAEELPYPLCAETFNFFPAPGRAHLPQPLRAKKRVAAIFKACFATLAGSNRADREKILRLALNTADFSKRGVKTEARRIITGFYDGLERRTLLQLHDAEWLAVAVDGEKEARLLEIPYQLFGAEIFMEAQGVGDMIVERKQLMKNLSRLRSALSAAGFTLAMGGEELETVSWSFTLDASRSSIDWFELRPEIRCEGELVDENELREALKSGGVFRRDGGLVLLDEESSRALSFFEAAPKREVVRVPRLQILDWISLRRSGVRVILSPDDERIIDSLTHFDRIPPRNVPQALKATLRKYQRDGYSWLAFLYEHRFGACLADDMGLGKTVQAIALMAGICEGEIATDLDGPAPHLVVVPPSLIFNWESELARFYPSLKIGVYRGQGRRADFSGLDLVLTSYGVIQRDIETLGALPFNVIVFDEAQAVKNIHAETTGAVRRLKGRFKLTLTGTPVENHLGEYFSVMDLALPGLLGAYEQFRREMGREGSGFMETLIRRTRPFILRRTKDMIAAELPPKVETDLYLEMSTRQKALYARTVAQVKATVAEAYRGNAPGQARIIALTAILKLRQICLSSKLLLPELSDRSPKIDFLIDQLQELFSEGHSVLVFSQFTSFLDVVQDALSQHGVPFLRLDGTTAVRRRKEVVESFQGSPEPSVFLLSLKAGGKGLNLTRASYVFHLDPWWNPAVENQASDRAHRIGQKRQVTITRLLMRHSIEEKMMELKKRKLKLYRALLEDAEHEGGSSLGREDFEFLLG